jgi:putative NADH-flavin reductase
MRIIVFGATGGSGRAAIDQAIAAGHEVTAFVRRPEALTGIDKRVKIVAGDATDTAAVTAAIAGHDVVISGLGTRPWRHRDICSEGTRAIIAGMQASGVRRVIVMSSLGVGDSWQHTGLALKIGGAILLRKAFRDKAAMEDLLRATDLDWIVVRPGLLTNGKARGRWRAADDGSLRSGSISRADTAAFMLAQLTSNEWLRRLPIVVW